MQCSFAVAISKTGLPDAMVDLAIKMVGQQGDSKRKTYSKVFHHIDHFNDLYFITKT